MHMRRLVRTVETPEPLARTWGPAKPSVRGTVRPPASSPLRRAPVPGAMRLSLRAWSGAARAAWRESYPLGGRDVARWFPGHMAKGEAGLRTHRIEWWVGGWVGARGSRVQPGPAQAEPAPG